MVSTPEVDAVLQDDCIIHGWNLTSHPDTDCDDAMIP
jgi:hypothetical protein